MDGAFDIPDSTDWLNTPLALLSTLENALHCQICKEFYDTPMTTSCCHTFCSKCIRTSLSTDGKCPACRTADQASKLRNNWALQEVVLAFLAARPAALGVARKERDALEEAKRGAKSGKRKRAVLDSDVVAQMEAEGRSTRRKSQRIAASHGSQPEAIDEVDDSDAGSTFEPEHEEPIDDGLVECPLGCGKRMKIEAVEPHLDRCEDERKQASRSQSRTPVSNGLHRLPNTNNSSTTKPQDRISEFNYSLLNETKLRKKLEEASIPAWGPKQLLIKRHTEWVNLWNANCDSSRPRSKRELLQELDTWERTQGGRAPGVNGLASSVMRKDFDGVGWANKNRGDFAKLIDQAKRKYGSLGIEGEGTGKNVDEAGQDGTTVKSLEGAGDIPPPSGQSARAGEENVEATDLFASRRDESMTPSSEQQHDPHNNHTRRPSLPIDVTPAVAGSPPRKVPMFRLPEVPVRDVDADGHGGH